jgi:mRNA (guanine-N7-)-methyltransferase
MFQSKSERAKSYFYNMRRFHNNVKRQLYDKYTRNINKLLDLACGKGGDLDKWVSNNIKMVIGYDIDEKSIIEAQRRVNEYRTLNNTNVEVYVKDLSRNVISGNNDCDVVTSMFAFHYFFETEETFNNIMKTIDNNLKMGGYFVGTMFDGESIKRLLQDGDYTLKDNGEVKFNINVYKPLTDNPDNPFGNKIGVYLKDTVLDVPMDEYIVYFDQFVELMRIRGYDLVETKMFKYLDTNSRLNEVEKSVSYLNRYFVFKKKGANLCKEESKYLMECDWPFDISELKKQRLLKKYKKALDNKISSASERLRMDYIFIKENFGGDNILSNPDVSNNIKKYYEKIYGMFLQDLQK